MAPLSQVAKTSGAVSVLITSTTVAAANPGRREITIVNDGANTVYLALNTTDGTTVPTATANSGIRINSSGGSWTTNTYKGPVAGIASGGTSVCTVAEI